MYAKSTKGLQRLLRVYWVVHNFLRVHFTTREVPAVALGILERRLSVHEIFQIQMLGFYHLSSFRCSDLGCWVYYENTLPSPPRSEH